jgi:hypothetical protein
MRTTLSIDDDVLANVRVLAQRDGRTLGEVVSDLVRKGMRKSPAFVEGPNGFLVLAERPTSEPVTLELVNELRDLHP